MALIGVLSAIAMPRYANALNRYRAVAGAKRIAADLALAQSRAQAKSASQTVVFDAANATYQLPGVGDLDRPTKTYLVNLTTAPYLCSFKIITCGPNSTITFNGFGIADSDCKVQVQSGNASQTLTFDRNSGKATVK